MAARSRVDPRLPGGRAPRVDPVRLGELDAGSPAQFGEDDADLDGLSFTGLSYEDLTWDGRRRLGSSSVTGLTAASWRAPGAMFSGSVLHGLDVLRFAAADSGWRQVEIRESRLGSAELHDATLRSVHFVGCRIGYLNLRDAHVTDLAFTDCVIDDLDLMRTQAARVALAGCRVGRLETTGARLSEVDLRGALLTDLSGLEGLRGTIISPDQLIALAPVLADRLGITVE